MVTYQKESVSHIVIQDQKGGKENYGDHKDVPAMLIHGLMKLSFFAEVTVQTNFNF